jgi:hypothetical protein
MKNIIERLDFLINELALALGLASVQGQGLNLKAKARTAKAKSRPRPGFVEAKAKDRRLCPRVASRPRTCPRGHNIGSLGSKIPQLRKFTISFDVQLSRIVYGVIQF